MKPIIGRRQFVRVYNKIKEDSKKILYEYRYEFVSAPDFTGLVEYDKQEKVAKLLKPADGEYSADKPWAYVQTTLAREGFPQRYTHTAS